MVAEDGVEMLRDSVRPVMVVPSKPMLVPELEKLAANPSASRAFQLSISLLQRTHSVTTHRVSPGRPDLGLLGWRTDRHAQRCRLAGYEAQRPGRCLLVLAAFQRHRPRGEAWMERHR